MLAKKFPTGEQLNSLVDVLMEGLTDVQSLCSNGACVVLNGIAKLRGAELEQKVCTPRGGETSQYQITCNLNRTVVLDI